MSARVEIRDCGPVVIAPLSEWKLAGRFILASFSSGQNQDDDPLLTMAGLKDLAEARQLAEIVNELVQDANPVRVQA